MKSPLIGVFGGMFDPIHNGHLHVVTTLLETINFNHIRLIPCFQPIHRQLPMAHANQRLVMIQLAIKRYYPKLIADHCEIQRQGISYTFLTLQSLKKRFSHATLCLILGRDAFNLIDQWQNWQDMLNLAHIIVVNRPNYDRSMALNHHQLATREIKNQHLLAKKSAGYIYHCRIDGLALSSSFIRQQLIKQPLSKLVKHLPLNVLDFIQRHKLYMNRT